MFTLPLHGDRNSPFRKEASDIDVPLPDGCGDADYLAALDNTLTMQGMQSREQRVFDWCHARRLPLVLMMAGGYGVRIEEPVAVQVNTYRVALDFWRRWGNG